MSSPIIVSRPFSRSRLEQLLGRRPFVFGGMGQRLEQLLFTRPDSLGLDDRGEDGLAPQLLGGIRLRFLDDLVARFALHLKVGVGAHAPAGELPFDPAPPFHGAVGDKLFRQIDLCQIGGGVDRSDPEILLDPRVDDLGEFLADVRPQLLERVELRCLGGEIVVELGQDFLPDLFDVNLEDRVLAGELLGLIVVGEADLDLPRLARAHTDELSSKPSISWPPPSSSR